MFVKNILLWKKVVVETITCHSMKNHVIKYSASKVDIVCNNLLIDRRLNGGVAGEDVRIRFAHPDRQVDIRGIDDHEINSISIVTTGKVDSTTIG